MIVYTASQGYLFFHIPFYLSFYLTITLSLLAVTVRVIEAVKACHPSPSIQYFPCPSELTATASGILLPARNNR